MREPVIVVARVHRWPSFLVAALTSGVAAILIAGVPLPQVGSDLDAGYVQSVGFFIVPLLPVPAFALTLQGAQQYEYTAARRLVATRAALALAGFTLMCLALFPSALLNPTPDATSILLENLSLVAGLTLIISRWLSPRWSWAPVCAIAFAGATGPDRGWASTLVIFDRSAALSDLVLSLSLLLVGTLTYALKPPRSGQQDDVYESP